MKKVNNIKGTQIIHIFNDGAKVVQILTSDAAKVEKNNIKSEFPFGSDKNALKHTKIFSIRDRHNRSVMDIQTHPDVFSDWEDVLKAGVDTTTWLYEKGAENRNATHRAKLYREFINQLYVLKNIKNVR